ncbi:MAG TPA: response regulator [Solirubrobacteraceae bacterium]|jgi:CheY-like chemotaxis protein|nr:response regulator [Solirubrobacteraceae bacterium]
MIGDRGEVRILVVDDNPTNLKLVSTVLRADGFDVYTAVDGGSALVALRDYRPALVFTDVHLPDFDGLELTRMIKADPETAGIVVVALTASVMAVDESRALLAGCDGFIVKPFDTRNLGATADRYLGRMDGAPGPSGELTAGP